MPALSVSVVSIPVSDQQRSKAFYRDVLGFSVINEMETAPGMHWIQVVPPGSDVTFALVTDFPTMPAGSLDGTVFATDDIHATYAELAERGLTWETGINDAFWGTHAGFRDPDGNQFIVAQLKPLA